MNRYFTWLLLELIQEASMQFDFLSAKIMFQAEMEKAVNATVNTVVSGK